MEFFGRIRRTRRYGLVGVPGEQVVAAVKPECALLIGLTLLLIGRMWTLGLWIRVAAEHFKRGLMGHPSRRHGRQWC